MRKKHKGGHENHERWLLTYADMITLLVAFFIMLYAMSVTNKIKFQALALSVRSGFDGNSKMQAVSLSPGKGIAMSNALISPQRIKDVDIRPQDAHRYRLDGQTDEEQSMAQIKAKIEAVAAQHHVSDLVQVNDTERGLVIRILTDKLLFSPGDAHLQTSYLWLLDVVAGAVRTVPNDISVEGHTDSLPIHTAEYPSNWELSTSRATNVLRYMVEHENLPPDRLCAAGYADTKPIVPDITDNNRSKNRRVDIVILRSSADNQLEQDISSSDSATQGKV